MVTGLLSLKVATAWLSNESLGLWTFLYAAASYFSLLELGLGQGVARLLGGPVARGETEKASQLVSTGLCIVVAQAALVGLVGLSIGESVLRWAGVPPELRDKASLLWWAVVLVQGFTLPLVLLQAVLWVQNRVYLVYGIGTVTSWLGLGALYVGLSRGEDVVAYVWSIVLSALVSAVLLVVALAGNGQGIRFRLAHVSRGAAGEIFGFSFAVFTTTLVPQLAMISQSVIAARVSGLEVAAVLGVNTRIGWMLYSVAMRAFDAFIPRWNAACGASGIAPIRAEYVLVGRVTVLAAIGATILVLLCNRPFIQWWARPDLFGGTALTVAVALTILFQTVVRVWMFPIRLVRNLTQLAWVLVIGLVLELVLQWTLASRFGLAGLVAAAPIAGVCLVAWYSAAEFSRIIGAHWRVVLAADGWWYGPSLVTALVLSVWWTPPGSPQAQLATLSCVALLLLVPVGWRSLVVGRSMLAMRHAQPVHHS